MTTENTASSSSAINAASAVGIATALVSFVREMSELFPELKSKFASFWGDNNLGPMPPDMALWSEADAAIDSELAKIKADAPPDTTPTGTAPQ